MKILVVDDEKLLVKGIKFNLENEGYTVDTCFDGESAVNMARSGEAQAYRACADRRLTVLLDRSVRSAPLEPFPSQPYLLYFEDIGEDPESWVNVFMSIYYDKDSLWIQPR